KNLHTSEPALVEQQLPIPPRIPPMFQIKFQSNNSSQLTPEEHSFFRFSSSRATTSKTAIIMSKFSILTTVSSSLQKSFYAPDSTPIQLNNNLQFTPEKSPPVSFSLSPLQKSSYASDFAPVEQQLSTLTEELSCFRLNCSIATSSSSLQRSFHASDSVPNNSPQFFLQQLPRSDFSRTTASNLLQKSLYPSVSALVRSREVPISLILLQQINRFQPLQKNIHASDLTTV
uniref:Uncharacterized protein n=1 Tax=Strongyloides stercoralis TaxID=6248 RepID=A0AAF5D0V1_STRER